MRTAARTILLDGGGRWARVHAGVLASFLAPAQRVIWHTVHSTADAARRIAELGETARFRITSDFEEAAASADAAIVASRAVTHAATGLDLLSRRIPVLVEKPMALDTAAATRNVTLAQRHQLPYAVSLPLARAAYLRDFGRAIEGRALVKLAVEWLDPPVEQRNGETKAADLTLHMAHDIVPHVWTILRALGARQFAAGAVHVTPTAYEIQLRTDKCNVTLTMGRRAARRTRRVAAAFGDGGIAELDFADEPGTAKVDGASLAVADEWHRQPRPLASVLAAFLSELAAPGHLGLLDAGNAFDAVELACELRRRMTEAAVSFTAKAFARGRETSEHGILAPMLDELVAERPGTRPITALDRVTLDEIRYAGTSLILGDGKLPSGSLSAETAAMVAGSQFVASVRKRLLATSDPTRGG